MATTAVISYVRVSTSQQGRSGLGIEAQRQSLRQFAQAEGLELAREFVEVETGKGSDALDRRPQLKAALAAAALSLRQLLQPRRDLSAPLLSPSWIGLAGTYISSAVSWLIGCLLWSRSWALTSIPSFCTYSQRWLRKNAP